MPEHKEVDKSESSIDYRLCKRRSVNRLHFELTPLGSMKATRFADLRYDHIVIFIYYWRSNDLLRNTKGLPLSAHCSNTFKSSTTLL